MHRFGAALVWSIAACGLQAGAASAAQATRDYPARPIRLLVPQTAGSSTDTMTRVLAAKMSELLGQQLVIDNRTGVGGVVAGGIVANADPDGYTLLCAATPSQVIGPQLYRKSMTYDTTTAFTPVAQFAVTHNVLVANLKAPFRDVKELIAYARANPGKINWGNAGTGFQSHLAGVLFSHRSNIDVLHVAYKGAGPLVTGVISGESHVTLGPAPAWMVHVQSGRARAIAMAGDRRSVLWPDLPTIIESGLPGFVSDGWVGLLGPRGLPKDIMNRLHDALTRALNDPATSEALKKVGAEPRITTPQAFAALIARDYKTYGEAIRVANLKVE
jgi:tripartite-type tricarboxylate transporter receptor subunit TctC